MAHFIRLHAWQAAHQLVLRIYGETKSWPSEERYGLTSQIRRAAVSIPTNIAEGSARKGTSEFRRFLDIAGGSHAEVEYLLRLASELEYLRPPDSDLALDQCAEVGRLLWGLHRSLRQPSSRLAVQPTRM
jgi:four helix bundle protein